MARPTRSADEVRLSTLPAETRPAPSPRLRPRLPDVAGWLGLAALVVVAVWLRLPLLDLGYTSDEIANVTDAPGWSIVDHPETGVNPPALRWWFNVAFEPWDAPWWGRRFSLLCSVAAVVLAYGVGRAAAGGSVLAGLAAAALLAVHPFPVRFAGLFRAYAWWSATALLHVLAMGRVLDGGGRRWLVLAVLTALLMPWIHYFSVPVLLGFGAALVATRGRRRLVLAYVPAAVGVLPLVPYVLFEEGRRVGPEREALGMVMVKLGSLELQPPRIAFDALGRAWAGLTGAWPMPGTVMLLGTLLLLGVALAAWRWLPGTGRLCAAGLVAVLGGAVVFAQVQYVRPSTIVMVATFAGPLFVAVPALLPRPWLRVAGVLLVAWWYGAGVPQRFEKEADAWAVEEAAPWLTQHWREFDEARGERPMIVHPAHNLWTVWFHLSHEVPRRAPRGALCEGYSPCFEHGGVAWGGVDRVGDGALIDGVVFHGDAWRPEGFASTCTPLFDHGTWAVFDCRRGAR